LDDLGVKVVSPRERDRRAGIVTFRVYRSPKRDWELVRKLINGNIVVSMRYTSGVGGIRASVHYFNNEGDIDRLIESISGLK
jgi:selenocysteine lyase/cysteine desulfurase